MDFGHGFIPRIDRRNAAAVDRAVGPPGQATLDGATLSLPWVIVDPFFGAESPAFIRQLKGAGTRVLIDVQAWRYREAATFSNRMFATSPIMPRGPLSTTDRSSLHAFVRNALRHQHQLGADAYLVPGILPRGRDDVDAVIMTRFAIDHALADRDLAPLPMAAWIGGHMSDLDAAFRLVTVLHHGLSALYVQLTPVDPLKDPASKLGDVLDLLSACERESFPVIAGHLGAMTTVLRAAGVSACDAGLGLNERFAAPDKLRPSRPQGERTTGGWGGPRIYDRHIGRSVLGRVWRLLLEIDEVRGRLRCPELCCRFRTLDTTIHRAVEHTLHNRVADAIGISAVVPHLRSDHVRNVLEQQRSMLATCNSALSLLGQPRIDGAFLDQTLTAVARRAA